MCKQAVSGQVPAVSLRSAPLRHRLYKDSQFLQSHIGSCAHPDDTDAQAVTV